MRRADMALKFLASFKPDGDALLRRISKHIDDATLKHIAKRDPVGGDARRAGLLDGLRRVRDHGIIKIPSDNGHDLREVLQFSSMSEPDAVNRDRRGEWPGTRGHWERAFSCAALMRAYGDYDTRCSDIGDYNHAMIQLLESLRRLGTGFEPQAMAALAWFIIRLSGDQAEGDRDQLVFAGVGILSLAVNSSNMISGDTIIELTEWLIAEEKRAFDDWGESVGDFPDHWLFRITYFDKHREKWMAIGAELAAFEANGRCGDAVRAIGQRLSGQTPAP